MKPSQQLAEELARKWTKELYETGFLVDPEAPNGVLGISDIQLEASKTISEDSILTELIEVARAGQRWRTEHLADNLDAFYNALNSLKAKLPELELTSQ